MSWVLWAQLMLLIMWTALMTGYVIDRRQRAAMLMIKEMEERRDNRP